MAFPDSRLAHLDITAAKTAVTDRKKTVLNSTGGGGNERVPSNECVTDAMLDGLLAELLKSTPASEVRPRVVRSPISSRGTPRTQVVRSPILPLRALPPPGSPHAHPNPLTSPPPPSTTRTARRTLTVASSPPNATLGTPFVTPSGTDPVAVATVPEAVAGLAPVDAEQEDDEPGVQCESEADEGTAEDVAAVPVMSAALVPADPVPMAAAAVEPALVEADEHGARLVASVGEEVRGEPGVRVEANVHGEVAEEGTVAANVETVVEVPSGEDAPFIHSFIHPSIRSSSRAQTIPAAT